MACMKRRGKKFLEALKGVMVGGGIADMAEFKGSCPDELLQGAVLAQRILAEDLMPLKRKLLPAHQLQACVDTLVHFLDFQYEEGKKFCTEHSSSEILSTRVVTVGGLLPMLLMMDPDQAQLYTIEDAGLIQLSLIMMFMNDIVGLFKDLEAVERLNDASAYLNLVRVGMRELGISDKAALHIHARSLNRLIRSFETFMMACSPVRRAFYSEPFKLVFNYLDYHLTGIMSRPNTRYGWSVSADDPPLQDAGNKKTTPADLRTSVVGVLGYFWSSMSRLTNGFLKIGSGRTSQG